MKEKYDDSFLRKIDPDRDFFWKWVPSVGRSGGIICGVKNCSLEVQSVKIGAHMILMNLWDKNRIADGL
jgi:hypothetical protein